MSYTYKEIYRHRSIPELLTARLMENFGLAIVSVAWSILFLERGVTDGEIGLIKGYSVILSLLISLLLPRLLERYDEAKVYPATLGLSAAFLYLAGIPSVWAIFSSFLLLRLVTSAKVSSFSVMFRDTFKRSGEYGVAQGAMSGLCSFAWLAGPFLGGLLMDRFGAPLTTTIAATVIAMAAVIALLRRTSHGISEIKSSLSPIKNIRFYTQISGLKLAYFMRSGVDIWWAFCFTFLPLYMIHSGYNLFEIGLVLSLTQVPLVIGEFMTIRILKYLSFKSVFSCCYLYLFILSAAAFFVPQAWLAISFLIMGSFAVSFLEPLTEVYFYKLTERDEEERAYPIFITSSSLGEGFLNTATGFVLTIFSFKYGFAVVSLSMLGLFLAARHIKGHADWLTRTLQNRG